MLALRKQPTVKHFIFNLWECAISSFWWCVCFGMVVASLFISHHLSQSAFTQSNTNNPWVALRPPAVHWQLQQRHGAVGAVYSTYLKKASGVSGTHTHRCQARQDEKSSQIDVDRGLLRHEVMKCHR